MTSKFNFIPVFLRKKHSSISAIQKVHATNKPIDITVKLQDELNLIDEKIRECTKALLEAHSVQLKSLFSTNSGWLTDLRAKRYISSARESASWHSQHLIRLQKERRHITIQLEKATGKFWSNRIKRWLAYSALAAMVLIAFWVIFMGLITALYLLPIWGSILIVYLLASRF